MEKNDHIEPSVESLVAEFNKCGKGAAEHIIRRGKAVARAKAKGKNGYEEFCAGAELKLGSSTTRKYLKIGVEADWLLPMADKMPPDWTTIYCVAVLGEAKAKESVRLSILTPCVTAKELKAATIDEVSYDVVDQSEADETDGAAEPCVFQVDASDLTDDDRLNLYHALEKAAAQRGCVVEGLPEHLAEKLIIQREAA